MAERYLAVFSVGPVQSFIASARKTEDLWSGSYILSHLVRAAIYKLYLHEESFQLLFPLVTKDEIENPRKDNIHIASLPNRFTATLSGSLAEVEDRLNSAQAEVKEEFFEMFETAVDLLFPGFAAEEKDVLLDIGKKQIESLLEIYWVLEPFPDDAQFGQVRARAESLLAAVKNDKRFSQIEQQGLTCSVCHEREALSIYPFTETDAYADMKRKLAHTWKKRSPDFQRKNSDEEHARIKDNEYLCAICTVKRLARDCFKNIYDFSDKFKSFKSTHDIAGEKQGYYGVLMMDGDNMGRWFSGDKIEDYRNVSRRLANYSAETVPEILGKSERAMLVYAGGDDVLAFLPLEDALDIAHQLRFAFSDEEKGLAEDATSSDALIIAHKTAPLRNVLNEARRMESKAKSFKIRKREQEKEEIVQEKDALAISVLTRSGERADTILPWRLGEEKTVEILQTIIHLLKDKLSDTFIYRFIDAFYPLIDINNSEYKVCEKWVGTELKRLLKRSAKSPLSEEELEKSVEAFISFYQNVPSTMDFIYTLKILSFFKRKEV